MKCTGITVHSLANSPGQRFIFNMCSFHLFSTLPSLFFWVRQEGTSFQQLLGNFKYSSTKKRAEDSEKRRGTPTIPRPSFDNYTEYLLTGGLSLCLLSHPTPLTFPLKHPHHFPSYCVYHVVLKGGTSHFQAWWRQKKRKMKKYIVKHGGEASFETQPLIWEPFQWGDEGASYCSPAEGLPFTKYLRKPDLSRLSEGQLSRLLLSWYGFTMGEQQSTN